MPVSVPLLYVLLVALAVVSSLLSVDSANSWVAGVSLVGTSLVAIYFGVRFQPPELLRILWHGCTIMIIASLVTVVAAPDLGVHVSGEWRGIFSHKNTLGSMMVIALVTYVFAHLDRVGVGLGMRLVNLATLLLAAVLLLFSGSATSLVTLFVTAAVVGYAAVARRTGLVRGPLMLLAVWLMAVIAFVVLSDLGAFTELLGKDLTLTGRTDMWIATIPLIEARPLWGYGYGNDMIRRMFDVVHVHNGYLQLTIAVGLVGLGLLLGLLVQIGWKCYAHAMASTSPLSLWPLAIFVALITTNFSEASLLAAAHIGWLLLVYLSTSGALIRTRRLAGDRAPTGSVAALTVRRRARL